MTGYGKDLELEEAPVLPAGVVPLHHDALRSPKARQLVHDTLVAVCIALLNAGFLSIDTGRVKLAFLESADPTDEAFVETTSFVDPMGNGPLGLVVALCAASTISRAGMTKLIVQVARRDNEAALSPYFGRTLVVDSFRSFTPVLTDIDHLATRARIQDALEEQCSQSHVVEAERFVAKLIDVLAQ